MYSTHNYFTALQCGQQPPWQPVPNDWSQCTFPTLHFSIFYWHISQLNKRLASSFLVQSICIDFSVSRNSHSAILSAISISSNKRPAEKWFHTMQSRIELRWSRPPMLHEFSSLLDKLLIVHNLQFKLFYWETF